MMLQNRCDKGGLVPVPMFPFLFISLNAHFLVPFGLGVIEVLQLQATKTQPNLSHLLTTLKQTIMALVHCRCHDVIEFHELPI